MQNNMSFSAPLFKGGASINGKPVFGQGRVVETVGGIFSTATSNDTYEAVFGRVVSVTPAKPNEFLIGLPTSGIVAGLIQFDASIAQNDPAKPGYYLKGTPIAVQYQGGMIFETWGKTQAGAIDPIPGALPQFNNTTGEVEFLPAGSSASAGWTLLSAKVAQVDQNGYQGVELSLSVK